MNCPGCGKEIRLIAVSWDAAIPCDLELQEIITESGHSFKGYMRHECKNEDERERCRNSG